MAKKEKAKCIVHIESNPHDYNVVLRSIPNVGHTIRHPQLPPNSFAVNQVHHEYTTESACGTTIYNETIHLFVMVVG